MVTAEVALAMPVLVAVVAAALWVLACLVAELRCIDAAAMAARLAARGAPVARVVSELAPAGAQVRVTRRGQEVTAEVQALVRPFGGALALPMVTVRGRALAVMAAAP